MKNARVLSLEIAQKFLKLGSSKDLARYTTIEESAAEALSKCKGSVSLSGITTLSKTAAGFLAKVEPTPFSDNCLNLESLDPSIEVAIELAKYRGDQIKLGVTSIDLPFAKAMVSFQGSLMLRNISRIEDDVAAELAKRIGGLNLDGLEEFHDWPGHIALARVLTNHETLFLRRWKEISPGALDLFAEFNGKHVEAEPMMKKKLSALRIKKNKECVFTKPEEWNRGLIVPLQLPAKPLKGNKSERAEPEWVSWWLPKKVCNWFVQKLDDDHKCKVSQQVCISPEAEKLLREKADAWLWLMESEVQEAQAKEAASIKSLGEMKPPKQFKDDNISLPPPNEAVALAYCWKPDFEGEDYQSVLHYYGYLSADHVGSIIDSNGYPAKCMSPEAANLYRENRAFWEAKHIEKKLQVKADKMLRKQQVEQRLDHTAQSAGLSRKELETKLDRLSALVDHGDFTLAADMIAGFGDPWLYEALLAGACITTEGDLKPGKVLKRFKKNDKTIMLLAVAFMPENIQVDASIHRGRVIQIDVENETIALLEEYFFPNIPNLMPRTVCLLSLENLSHEIAKFISKCSGSFVLDIKQMPDAVALALADHIGSLALSGFSTLTDVAAEAFSRHRGELELGVSELSEHHASLLANHCGALVFSSLTTITADAIRALADHQGGCSMDLHGRALTDSQAQELAMFRGNLRLYCAKLSTVAAKYLAQKSGDLHLVELKCLDVEAAGYLSHLKGSLVIGDRRRQCKASSDAIEALVKTLFGGELNFDECELTDTACEALAAFVGDVAFRRNSGDSKMAMTPNGALMLAKRKSLGVLRTRIPKAARKILENYGSWRYETWIRNPDIPLIL